MVLTAERRTVYLDERMHDLQVANPHFDFRDEFDAAVRVGGVTESIERRLYANFYTAVGEDVLRRGSFELEFCKGRNGRPILITADHREFGDITQITLNGARKKRAAGKSYARELAELQGMRKLRRRCLDCPNDSRFILISPPGPAKDGYSGVSLTYIYRVKGDPGVGRRVKATFYKNALSLEGHVRLFALAEPAAVDVGSEVSPKFFVSRPIDISDNSNMQTADDVMVQIDRVAGAGERFVVPGVGVGSNLTPEMFALYEPQIRESTAFLTSILAEKLRNCSMGLNQKALVDLELAYSLARRAVSCFASNGKIISAGELIGDYRRQRHFDELQQLAHLDNYGPLQTIYAEASQFRSHLEKRYGDIRAQEVGRGGCPGGTISSIGISLDGFSLPTFGEVSFAGTENNTKSELKCCKCPFCQKIVNAIVEGNTIKCPNCKTVAKI